MLHSLALLTTLAAFWLLWSGIYAPLILVFGALSCLGVLWLSHRMRLVDAESGVLVVSLRLWRYWPWLLKEIVIANMDVAVRVLSPRVRIHPRVFRVRATQANELGRVIYANSITITPGTVTMAVEGHRFLVHSISRRNRAQLLKGEMDRRITSALGGRS